MYRKKSFSDEVFLHFSSKVQNLTVFSIIYMIRNRFFGPRELIQRYFFGRTVKIEEVGGPLKAEQVDDDDKKAHCVQSVDKTEDEAKMLAHQFVDNEVIEVCEEQLSHADDHIAVVQKSISEFHASVAKVSGIKQNQHSDFVTLTPTVQPRRSCSSSPSTG